MNDYLFDNRTFSNFSYKRIDNGLRDTQNMRWSILTDCSYSINTQAYTTAISEVDDFDENLSNIQNAILMDRIVSSIQLLSNDITGFGQAIHNQNLARISNNSGNVPFHISYEMASNRLARHHSILKAICQSRLALVNFILSTHSNTIEEHSPFNDDWLNNFIETFSRVQTDELATLSNLNKKEITNILASALTIGRGNNEMTGGAMTLRSGTRIGLPFRLRQRADGRPITEQMRRDMNLHIRRFIDSLPSSTRQRRYAPPPPEIEDEQSDHSSFSDSDLSRNENNIIDFNDQIVRTVIGLIEALEEELTPRARNSRFFNFTNNFFALLTSRINLEEASNAFIRRWIINFFIMEHISATLFYLQSRLIENRTFRRNSNIDFSQVIMRARLDTGEQAYARLWSTRGEQPFLDLVNRISHDLIATTEAIDRNPETMSQEELDQMLEDIQFQDSSGDVNDVIDQIKTHDPNVDSIELSFRSKISGLVGYSRNEAVIESYERIRTNARPPWQNRAASRRLT
uniref:PTP n=1 Tax=Zoothera dauma adenovirus TaxID=3073259 RepID=A0AA51NQ92_9ADEN|nr:pTP [Zoothera dauma adenovirus]